MSSMEQQGNLGLDVHRGGSLRCIGIGLGAFKLASLGSRALPVFGDLFELPKVSMALTSVRGPRRLIEIDSADKCSGKLSISSTSRK